MTTVHPAAIAGATLAMACRVSISSAMVTLPITVLLVGFTLEINDLGSMGCDELAVDVGAIKGSYQSCGFVFVHLRLPL